MKYCISLILSLGAAICSAHAETYLIQAIGPGHEATVRIPVGAITNLSASFAQSFADRADSGFESMRLSGGVVIGIQGSNRPILIEADSLVLELSADAVQENKTDDRATVPHSDRIVTVDGDSQVFIGDVQFDVPTSAGLMQIKADRVERRAAPQGGPRSLSE